MKFKIQKPRLLAAAMGKSGTAWKVSKYGVFPGPYVHVFGLNTEIYEVNVRIHSEYRKIRTRKNSVFGHFSHSVEKLKYKNTCWESNYYHHNIAILSKNSVFLLKSIVVGIIQRGNCVSWFIPLWLRHSCIKVPQYWLKVKELIGTRKEVLVEEWFRKDRQLGQENFPSCKNSRSEFEVFY